VTVNLLKLIVILDVYPINMKIMEVVRVKKLLFVFLIMVMVIMTGCSGETDAKKESDDPYTHHEVSWSDDYNGLKSTVQKVVTMDGMIGIKLVLENTTDHEFTTNATQGILTLNTDETIEGTKNSNPTTIGTISPGGKIVANLNFNVESNVEDINNLKLQWYVYDESKDISEQKKSYTTELEIN